MKNDKDQASDSAGSASSAPTLSGNGVVAAAVSAAVAAGRIGAVVGRGRRRGFAEFSEQAQVIFMLIAACVVCGMYAFMIWIFAVFFGTFSRPKLPNRVLYFY